MNDSMKQKIKLDKYAVYEKGRLYEVIVFPFIRYMYAYSRTGGDHDRDGCQIDAGRDAYTYLCYALAILAEDPGKLLYFPCKQTGYDGYFSHNYNVIFCRPDLQFRRSLWTRIKKKLDKKHWQGKYILQYDREKFYDYFENVLVRKYGYAQYADPQWKNGSISIDYQGIWVVSDTLDELIEELDSFCVGEEESYYWFVGVTQVPQNEKVNLPCWFRMFWIDGKWQIKDLCIEDGELEMRGISQDTRWRFDHLGERYPLPFQNGDRLKIQMPFMKEPFYGILCSELDGNGCWYHWLNRNEEEGECVDLSYIEFNDCSGYSTLDWIERAP